MEQGQAVRRSADGEKIRRRAPSPRQRSGDQNWRRRELRSGQRVRGRTWPQDEASAADLGGWGAAELWDHGGAGGFAWRSGDAALGFGGSGGGGGEVGFGGGPGTLLIGRRRPWHARLAWEISPGKAA